MIGPARLGHQLQVQLAALARSQIAHAVFQFAAGRVLQAGRNVLLDDHAAGHAAAGIGNGDCKLHLIADQGVVWCR